MKLLLMLIFASVSRAEPIDMTKYNDLREAMIDFNTFEADRIYTFNQASHIIVGSNNIKPTGVSTDSTASVMAVNHTMVPSPFLFNHVDYIVYRLDQIAAEKK